MQAPGHVQRSSGEGSGEDRVPEKVPKKVPEIFFPSGLADEAQRLGPEGQDIFQEKDDENIT